jgi:hypothetical protein
MAPRYSFCESVHATGLGPWHLRKLTAAGQKLGGGIDTASLCDHVRPQGQLGGDKNLRGGGGWDLAVEITPHHLTHACPRCVAIYQSR